jgi:hypothetical protein
MVASKLIALGRKAAAKSVDSTARKGSALRSYKFKLKAKADKKAGKKLSPAQNDALKGKPIRPISPRRKVPKKKAEEAMKLKKYKDGGKVGKGKKVASADWMEGLSQKEIQQILGGTNRGKDGQRKQTKKKTIKRTANASDAQKREEMGLTKRDKDGMRQHSKKKAPAKKRVVRAKTGGWLGKGGGKARGY